MLGLLGILLSLGLLMFLAYRGMSVIVLAPLLAALAVVFDGGTPVLATRIDGAVASLGQRHPGLFEVGDEEGLAELFRRCEAEPAFLAELARRSRRLAALVAPERERQALRRWIAELSTQA